MDYWDNFFPKGTNLKIPKPEEVERAVNLINNRPRKCLDYRTPNEVFYKGRLDSDAIQVWIGQFFAKYNLFKLGNLKRFDAFSQLI